MRHAHLRHSLRRRAGALLDVLSRELLVLRALCKRREAAKSLRGVASRAGIPSAETLSQPELLAALQQAHQRGSAEAVVNGHLETLYRSLLILTFGGGTNEIQRDLIGLFGLGLPRIPRF